MIEKKIEMSNGNVNKMIEENLVSIYENMGWKKGNAVVKDSEEEKNIEKKLFSKKGIDK